MANGRGKTSNWRDPRGHSLRIYDDVFDSAAFAALSSTDIRVYLALLRELRGSNNGNLSLPIARAQRYGIKSHVTLARSLRALRAVGLIDRVRHGGADKDGERECSLYRVTDVEVFEQRKLFIEAMPATNDWKKVATVQQGLDLIEKLEQQAVKDFAARAAGWEKTKTARHAVTSTKSPGDVVKPKTKSRRDVRTAQPRHAVTLDEKGENQAAMRVLARFAGGADFEGLTSRNVLPYILPSLQGDCGAFGVYRRLLPHRTGRPCFTRLVEQAAQPVEAVA
ncbi:hypothetical protein [Hydrogenophaga atypica]|uniref:Helix-turn-helix domain-containing protein n=1 Tax=Hydrogenophaga atypica TaxID=249409 RepID=A0ABW2QNI5_9BURK